MKGDFTRNTFERSNHYTRVLTQQGRVQLDADWNEQVAIQRHHLRTMLADLIGAHGGPAGSNGFRIVRSPGLLAELRGIDGRPLSDGRKTELAADIARGDFVIGGGRYYVEGMLCENEEVIAFSEQAGYPFDPATEVGDLPALGTYLVYLDVWERHVDALEAGQLREPALGGPDTASRAQLVWQVKVLPDADTCDAVSALRRSQLPRLRADALGPQQLEPCAINPQARYRGLENQLYRVEIHRGGVAVAGNPLGRATFKWSRENGSVAFAIEDLHSDGSIHLVSLASLGRDAYLSLKEDDWVEVENDDTVLRGVPATLLQVTRIRRDRLQVTLHGSLDAGFSTEPRKHPLLRRWDQRGNADGVQVVETATATGDWIALEDGVQIQFAASANGQPSVYRRGDYWLVPARAAGGDVEWPRQAGQREAREPVGAFHYYAPLAVVTPDAGEHQVASCRRQFDGLAIPLNDG